MHFKMLIQWENTNIFPFQREKQKTLLFLKIAYI